MSTRTKRIIDTAIKRGQRALTEYESKRVLAAYGIPVSREVLVASASQARSAAKKIKYPVFGWTRQFLAAKQRKDYCRKLKLSPRRQNYNSRKVKKH